MNWKRGFVFSGIHLILAASLMIWNETPFWQYIRTERNVPVSLPHYQPPEPSDPDYTFNPCDEGAVWDGEMPIQEQVVAFANVPASLITGGHTPCTIPSPLNRMLQERYGRTHRSESLTLTIVCAAVALQWLLVGGFPLIRPSRWWLEPGALITIFTFPMIGIAYISNTYHLPPLPLILAIIFWGYWFGLLVWKLCRSACTHPAPRRIRS